MITRSTTRHHSGMSMEMLLILIFSLSYMVCKVSCLECYVCEEQEDNEGKCKSTVVTCNYGEDRCLSVIKWGSTPYWEIGAPMQYYINKSCANEEKCFQVHRQTIGLCERIEWRDWQCAECCQGDRCNYYITLGSSSVSSSALLMGIALFISLILAMVQ